MEIAETVLAAKGLAALPFTLSGSGAPSAPKFTKRVMKSMLLALLGIFTAQANGQTFRLAMELLNEREYGLSAVEFRRFAMESPEPASQSSAYLYAGYAYLMNHSHVSAGEMLDRAESTDASSAYSAELTLLNAENARLANDPDTALYFYDALAAESDQSAFQTFSLRRAASIHLTRGDVVAARQNLERSPMDESRSLQALETYANGKDKSPKAGGLWGLFPGAGYWYSGEIANGFRSLILNSLFIYGMVDTAQDDQWGAFAVISFFELTWYSGSIYGGVDAAHRYNRDRLDATIHAVESDMTYRPDPAVVIPLVKFSIQF